MNVVIIALSAGTAGVVHRDQMDPTGEAQFLFDEARVLMARELAAAVEGAKSAGAQEVTAHDATGLAPFHEDLLHPGATFVFGEHQQARFPELASADAAILLGHPAKAGTWGAVLCQTLAPNVQRVLVNGQELGTIGLHAALCGAQNVPVALVSGDNHACAEAEALLPGVRTCTTKWGFGFQAAKLRSPATVRTEIHAAAEKALSTRQPPAPFTQEPPFEVEVRVAETHFWDRTVFSPPLQERRDGRTAVFRGDDLAYLVEHVWELVQ